MATSLSDGSHWAVKIINKTALSTRDRTSLASEINIVLSIKHENIVQVKEIFAGKSKVCIVMELMSGGELFDRIVTKSFYSEQEAKVACLQIVRAIDYCHDRNIAHRDLKPENLLYSAGADDSSLKLADFGLAHILGPGEMMHNVCGTPGYVAPEVLSVNPAYGIEVDMWSIGVILFILLCGYPPFFDEDNQRLFAKIREARFEFADEFWSEISPEAKQLVSGLLVKNPKERFTAKQVLAHPWCLEAGGRHVHLASFHSNLSAYNAKRRMKKAIRSVFFAQVLKKHGEEHGAQLA